MLTKDNYTLEHINELRKNKNTDTFILERSIYAFGLLEALCKVKMPFIFKGGTSLMLLLEHPRRLSTDVDIIVPQGTDVESYLKKVKDVFPFEKVVQQERIGKNGIAKKHYKFYYKSPVKNDTLFYILLDILFEENHYARIVRKPIKNDLLNTQGEDLEVVLPSVDCILGDKLTAFAPHTTGIPLGIGKELEIIKQMYDVAALIDVFDDFEDVYNSYMAIVETEINYRGLDISANEVLMDTIDTAACIAGRGQLGNEYPMYLAGIKSISTHIYDERYSAEKAVQSACKTMYLAACILRKSNFEKIIDCNLYLDCNIGKSNYSKLSKLRKFNAEAFAYVVKTVELLEK
ncbi:hypothetical protein DWW82_00135 [Clostridium sp. AF17-2]|jgi:hypothetical protein|uniref:nucleotidyl transferase AbiEii/AbiGii toxin family protein n=1 Tax=unclassified Clostridium TaxID=2614128 RepID=UPI000E524F28|nr:MULTISPECIES: nucleotidyl transferase AbiEii/AbiGii toxin family protein [unclassified Clostridium]RGG79453.1 hypothetical protein DWW85_00135 [Clostridium sp. AF17-21AC]RHR59862.1 hypothetical protein DWW82_00135 [Clostridium sp. AF17-2]